MKRTIVASLATLSILALAACGGGNTERSIRAGRGTGTVGTAANSGGIPGALGTSSGPNITTPSQTGLGWGVVTATSNQDVWNFLANYTPISVNPTNPQVGYVVSTNTGTPCVTGPGLGSVPCQIKFTVTQQASPVFNPVALQSGTLTTALNSSTPDYIGDGFITIAIWDSLSGTNVSSDLPQGWPPIPVVIPLSTQTGNYNSYVSTYGFSFVGAANSVSGYTSPVNLIFADDDGAVGVVGSVTGTQFSGTLQFLNSANFGGQSGNVGQFQINACSIISPCP